MLPIAEGLMTRIFSRLTFVPVVFAAAVACLLLASGTSFANLPDPSSGISTPELARPPELEDAVQFWISIYSRVSTKGGLIHDSRELGVVYEEIRFKKGASRRARERQVDRVKSRYRTILRKLATGRRSNLSKDEARVLDLWPKNTPDTTFRAASQRLRFQLGQSDKFRAGVIRSGAWNEFIAKIFREHGVPPEIAALPHVESSFTPHAYSRIGAAGLWQFTRSTGRRFMQIDHVADERLDPHRATRSAAKLLSQNYQVTGSWPLAITAYNHGAAGMRRASRQLGTKDIHTIIRKYKGRTFGFASRNFYVEFLAALEVSSNSEKYFGPLTLDRPSRYETFELSEYVPADALVSALGISMSEFRRINPALRPAVWQGAKHVPRHFSLRLPSGPQGEPTAVRIASIPEQHRHAAQTRDIDYRVRRGDTLSTIARRFHVRLSELVAINNLRSRHRIRVGQMLKLPQRGETMIAAQPITRAQAVANIPSTGRYTVRRGDTIERIAARFGIPEKDLIAANDLRNRHRIYVGQSLNLTNVGQRAAEPPGRSADIEVALVEAAKPAVEEPLSDSADTLADEAAVGPEDIRQSLADPSEYRIANDNTIEVQGAETLGHYAEWLGIRASRLRALNDIAYGRHIAIGQRITLDISRVSKDEFERQRRGYHQNLQDDFFNRYEIEGTLTHVTRRGDSIWVLAEREYRVPMWLLRQYNPDLNFGSLRRGSKINVPEIKRREDTEAAADTATAQAG